MADPIKASDNNNPSLLLTEQTAKPAAPASGQQRLYFKTDHKLYKENSAGTEVEMATDGVVRNGNTTDGNLAVWNGNDADSLKDGGSPSIIGAYPYQIVLPLLRPALTTGTWTTPLQISNFDNFYLQSGNAISDYAEWPVLLCAGTWRIDAVGRVDDNRGISTFYFDGVSVGTMDWYSASQLDNQFKEITSITVAVSGRKTLRMASASKNGSSAGYYLTINTVVLTRTGD